jgi:NitT/TauT family transport system ATP-binding protein
MSNPSGLSGQTQAAALDGAGSAGAIEIDRLSKTYITRRSTVEALRNASFSVKPGEFVALVGPSGCGKSTLLHIASGLLDASEGEVTVAGRPAEAGRRDVGIMLQRPVLFPWRNVVANIMMPIDVFKLDKKEGRQRAQELIELVGLEGFEDTHSWELSGGMQQRVSLARLLVFEPQILLMDEPFAALDEFTRERLNSELAELHESLNRTVLYVTHNIQEAVFLADRVVVMKPRPGEILEVIDVPLPRPRHIEMVTQRETADLVADIRNMLGFDDNGKEQG